MVMLPLRAMSVEYPRDVNIYVSTISSADFGPEPLACSVELPSAALVKMERSTDVMRLSIADFMSAMASGDDSGFDDDGLATRGPGGGGLGGGTAGRDSDGVTWSAGAAALVSSATGVSSCGASVDVLLCTSLGSSAML